MTTDEESEHPGTIRPKKGAGWWGYGPPIRPLEKGIPRDFVDGGGLCWPIDRRRIPEDYTAKRLQKTIFDRLLKCEQIWKGSDPGISLKKMLMKLAVGRVAEMPFDQGVVEEVRSDLRIICKQSGHNDGLPREGDVVQRFEIMLIQSLLSAFKTRMPTFATGGQKASGSVPPRTSFLERQRSSPERRSGGRLSRGAISSRTRSTEVGRPITRRCRSTRSWSRGNSRAKSANV